ncbi:MAG: hypothetical protein ABJD66_00705 [Cellulophaga sp.]|uniref:hypothetical protein n=1 Tax=Cellulophaga sp. TaxID=1972202 RepID=UPI00326464D2|nr:hypothetical protein QYR09_11590 [Cellulophaga lytica]
MKNKLIILCFLLILTSCFEKSVKVKITDFSKPKYDTLVPNQNGWLAPYSNAYLQIKGVSNDTIKINFSGVEKKYIGAFKDEWNVDYYGNINVPIKFDPFKANKGEVSIYCKIH